jgi:hypothetical protein
MCRGIDLSAYNFHIWKRFRMKWLCLVYDFKYGMIRMDAKECAFDTPVYL